MSRYNILTGDNSEKPTVKTTIPIEHIDAFIHKLRPKNGDLFVIYLDRAVADKQTVEFVTTKFDELFKSLRILCGAVVSNIPMTINRTTIDGVESLCIQTPDTVLKDDLVNLESRTLQVLNKLREENKTELTHKNPSRPIIVH